MLLTRLRSPASSRRRFQIGRILLGAVFGLTFPIPALSADAEDVRHEDRIGTQQAEVDSGSVPAAAPDADRGAAEPSAVSVKIIRYAQRIIDRYDRDGDGQLQTSEWQAMRGSPERADRDGDGVIQRDELVLYMAEYGRERRIRLLPPQPGDLAELPPLLHPATAGAWEEKPVEEAAETPERSDGPAGADAEAARARGAQQDICRRDTKFYVPASRVAGAPAVFLNRDRDGDGQLTLSEFAPQEDRASLDEFARCDRNGDGMVTLREYLGRTGSPSQKTEEPTKQE